MNAKLDNNNAEDRIFEQFLRRSLSCDSSEEILEGVCRINRDVDQLESHRKTRTFRRLLQAFAVAAAIVLCSGLAFSYYQRGDGAGFSNGNATATKICLSDGSEVWLSPGATLTQKRNFGKKDRFVRLDGEAYFEVAHDQDRPFVVCADNFRVRVLGTSFNVKTSDGSYNAEVSLASGSIMMQNSKGANLVRLSPGQQAVINKEGDGIGIKETTPGDILMKRYNVVSLQNVTLAQILDEIYEVYGVRVSASGPDEGTTYNFSFQKSKSVGDVMEMLKFICNRQIFTIIDGD